MDGAPSVAVRLVAGDPRELRGYPGLRRVLTVQPGEVIDVIPEVAGRPPAGDGDLGEGLLAQVEVWAPAGSAQVEAAPAVAGEEG